MKCIKCASEIPVHSQFCMRCGTSVGVPSGATGVSAARVTMAAPQAKSKAPLAAAATVLVLLLAVGLIYGLKMLNPTNKTDKQTNGSRVTDTQGITPTGGPLLDKTGRVSGRPPTDKSVVGNQSMPQPTDIIDYLKFLKEIEKQRVLLSKKQLGQLLASSGKMTLLGAGSAIESGEPEKEARQTVTDFQKMVGEWEGAWNSLSAQFMQKAPPQSCQQLQTKYYDVLGKTSGSIAKAGNAFNKAMSGDPTSALDTLTGMQGSGAGSASKSVAEACTTADEELGKVCDQYRIHKDFAIQDEGGGSSLLGR